MEERLYEDVRHTFSRLKRAFLVGWYEAVSLKERCSEHVSELAFLAKTYGFEIVGRHTFHSKKVYAATYLSKGKLEEIKDLAIAADAEILIFDDELSPNQERNIERVLKKALLSRTELILEIFAQRAHTKEAKLQIELAKTVYQLPRLKRLWTHLSRQSSGGGFVKGEGERQIELDRRLLRKRADQLKREIAHIAKQRVTKRQARVRSAIPTFSIIGYTNAGKSTLLNALTHANVFVEDKLFATLDTTTRQYILPNGLKILLTDTVGFIRKIPHTLVDAFKSTLEEALHADVLLHVVDGSHPLAQEHIETTLSVLKELHADHLPLITVFNKADCGQDFQSLYPLCKEAIAISALRKDGFDALLKAMEMHLQHLWSFYALRVPQSQSKLIAFLRKEGHVLHLEYEGNDVVLDVELPKVLEDKISAFRRD